MNKEYTYIAHYCRDCGESFFHRMMVLCCRNARCHSTNIVNGRQNNKQNQNQERKHEHGT
jgi:hypothetical protein